jgi:hypothetical protein
MATSILSDHVVSINHKPSSAKKLSITEIKSCLEASLSELTEIVQLTLTCDLASYDDAMASAFLRHVVDGELKWFKALCQQLWEATRQGLRKQSADA